MTKLEEKTEDIFNTNPKSHLFVRAVEKKLRAEDYPGAMEILQKNIIRFTDYPTALLLYGETLAATGFFREAEENIKKASNILNSEKTFHYYMERLERYRKTRLDYEEDSSSKEVIEVKDDELESLAKELTGAKISSEENEEASMEDKNNDETETPQPVKEEDKQKKGGVFNFFGGEDLISETLAGIYFAQGNLEEARSIYEKLIALQPENEGHFRNKIAEVEEAMKRQ